MGKCWSLSWHIPSRLWSRKWSCPAHMLVGFAQVSIEFPSLTLLTVQEGIWSWDGTWRNARKLRERTKFVIYCWLWERSELNILKFSARSFLCLRWIIKGSPKMPWNKFYICFSKSRTTFSLVMVFKWNLSISLGSHNRNFFYRLCSLFHPDLVHGSQCAYSM